MRVAIVINTSWNIFNYRKGLINALQERGCEVLAIAPVDDFSEKLTELGCKFIPIPIDNKGSNPFRDLLLINDFISIYKKHKPDFILHFTIKPNTYGSIDAAFRHSMHKQCFQVLGTVFIRKGWVYKVVKLLYRFSFKIPKKSFLFKIKTTGNCFWI